MDHNLKRTTFKKILYIFIIFCIILLLLSIIKNTDSHHIIQLELFKDVHDDYKNSNYNIKEDNRVKLQIFKSTESPNNTFTNASENAELSNNSGISSNHDNFYDDYLNISSLEYKMQKLIEHRFGINASKINGGPLIPRIPVVPHRIRYSRRYRNITSFPWIKDKTCANFSVQFGKDLPLVYLVSYPRSGNSWIRYLIEGATGLYTGSVYHSHRAHLRLGFHGEVEPIDSGRTVVVKSHAHSTRLNELWSLGQRRELIDSNAPAILLIRNPIDAITSFWSFSKSELIDKVNTGFMTIDEKNFHSQEFRNFTENQLKGWEQVIEDRLIWSKNITLIFYEEVLENPVREIRKILKFLNIAEKEERLKCLQRNLNGPAKRLHDKINITFSDTEKACIGHSASTLVSFAISRGFRVPDIYYEMAKNFTSIQL